MVQQRNKEWDASKIRIPRNSDDPDYRLLNCDKENKREVKEFPKKSADPSCDKRASNCLMEIKELQKNNKLTDDLAFRLVELDAYQNKTA